MYEITIETNGHKIIKKAKTKTEVRRLVYLYGHGSQIELEAKVDELTTIKKESKKINNQENI